MKFVRYVSQTNVLDEFGTRIKAHRLANDMSRQEVAFQAGVPLSALRRLEEGRSSVDLMSFIRICLVLGLRERIPEWVPESPLEGRGRTRYRDRARRRASKQIEPRPDPVDDPMGYWSTIRWIWEP